MKLWIARDNNGFLGLYKEYPTWVKINDFREDWNGAFMASLPKSSFPEVTFENSPQMVEIELVKEE